MTNLERVIGEVKAAQASEIERERREYERRISDYRALVALFCSGTDLNGTRVERFVPFVLAGLAALAFVAWVVWKSGAFA